MAGTSVVPTTTLATQTANNTSTPNGFSNQSNGNAGAANVSKVDVHSLLYPGADTKVYAHLLLWFGGSNHMNVGYNSNDAAQVHRQITDMISRGIDGVIIDWYGPNNSIDDATKLVMAESEMHPGFSFAIMVDQGAIEWNSCPGCSPQAALINQLQYVEQTYFSSPAYMTLHGRPVVTNFNIDLSYSVDWNAVNSALAMKPEFLFQNNDGFGHILSAGSYSWVMPTTSDYGMGYLTNFYNAGMPLVNEQTVGATYKGFNDTLASWGSNRIMGQQCGQTWLQTFSEINGLYNSGKQLPVLQLVTWNDYEEGTEIESGISNCLSISASVIGTSLQWSITGNENSLDHYVPYISIDGENLMSLGGVYPGTSSVNLCSYSIPDGNYVAYVQAVGQPSITNQMSGAVKFALNCGGGTKTSGFRLGAAPSSLTIPSGRTGTLMLTVAPLSKAFNSAVALTCGGLPASLSCSFSPSFVTPGSHPATSVLTIAAINSPVMSHKGGHTIFAVVMSGFGLFGLTLVGRAGRKSVLVIVGIVLVTGVVVGSTACGGKAPGAVSKSSSAPNTYMITITGAAGSVEASTIVYVAVN